MDRIYLDYNASTPLAPAVKKVLSQAIENSYKNPSSLHHEGQVARARVEEARSMIAGLLGAEDQEVCFTSGATEAHNFLFQSLWARRPKGRDKIITTAVEHDSVIKPLEYLQVQGAELCILSVNGRGELDSQEIAKVLDERTLCVSTMLANNETGIIFPVQELAGLAHAQGALFHTDVACAVGKIPLHFKTLGADFLSFSGQKFYAPQGIGALVINKKVPTLQPDLLGGPQERGRRAGTENVLGILALEQALAFVCDGMEVENRRLLDLRTRFKNGIKTIDSAAIFYENPAHQLAGTLNVYFPGIKGRLLVTRLDLEGVAASFGSACHAGVVEASRVLLNMGVPRGAAEGAIRLSFGRMTTSSEIDSALQILTKVVKELK